MLQKKKTYLLALLAMTFLLQSCFKEDERGPAYFPSGLALDTVHVGSLYGRQVYYDLYSMAEKSSNENQAWDLAFATGENAWHVRLNSALMMWAGNTEDTNFAAISSAEGLQMNFDVSSGNSDSTAIGEWYYMDDNGMKSYHHVYVIDRGITSEGTPLGFKKISLDIEEAYYSIRYANLDGSDEQRLVIEKDGIYNYMHLSFENGLLKIEPPKNEWSLKFTRYSTILFTDEGEAYPYNVVGVLLNPYAVRAHLTTNNFFDITLGSVGNYEYSNPADLIGYAWKKYDFDDGFYTVLPNRSYIIKNNDGFYYRFRFISFYDAQGNKGSIGIEYSRL